jgi:hypothetical protein
MKNGLIQVKIIKQGTFKQELIQLTFAISYGLLEGKTIQGPSIVHKFFVVFVMMIQSFHLFMCEEETLWTIAGINVCAFLCALSLPSSAFCQFRHSW